MFGTVKKINALDLIISLPNGLSGFLSIREVSDVMASVVDAFIQKVFLHVCISAPAPSPPGPLFRRTLIATTKLSCPSFQTCLRRVCLFEL